MYDKLHGSKEFLAGIDYLRYALANQKPADYGHSKEAEL